MSLFTGAGGLDLGLERAGFKIGACLEVDSSARETLRLNRPKWQLLEPGDIFEHDPEGLLAAAGVAEGDISILSCGPPCQPFSKATYWRDGAARGLSDPRAKTLDAVLNIVEHALPDVLLLENVVGITSPTNGALSMFTERLDVINRRRNTRYFPTVLRIDARDFGVPQHRERAFILATRDGQVLAAPQQTHARVSTTAPGERRLQPWTTAWDAIGPLATRTSADDLGAQGSWASLLPTIPEGSNYLWHTPRGGGMPLFGWRRRYWSFLLKLAKNRPSWTLQASAGPSTGPFHWNNRRLSREEMARLQTFPDDYEIVGTYAAAQRQLGNAVPAALGELLGLEVRRQRYGSHVRRSLRLIPAARNDCPRPERRRPVPPRFAAMRADHAPHPGKGLGPGALTRRNLDVRTEVDGG